MRGQVPQPFNFKIIGLLATIGRRLRRRRNFCLAVFRVPRVIAVAYDLPEQLPGLPKKVRVALDWTLELIFSKDFVQLPTLRPSAMSETEHSATAMTHETDAAQVSMKKIRKEWRGEESTGNQESNQTSRLRIMA